MNSFENPLNIFKIFENHWKTPSTSKKVLEICSNLLLPRPRARLGAAHLRAARALLRAAQHPLALPRGETGRGERHYWRQELHRSDDQQPQRGLGEAAAGATLRGAEERAAGRSEGHFH